MAPTPTKTASGKWQVRWRDSAGRLRQKTFTRKTDATRWATHVEYMRQMGELATVDRGRMTLDDLATEVRERRWNQKAEATRRRYVRTWNNHVGPYLHRTQIARIDGPMIEDWLLQLEEDGVGADARRRALSLLRSILSRGVEWGYLRANPSSAVPMPAKPHKAKIVPITPAGIEAVARATGRKRDAMLIRTMGFAGPRPQEAFALDTDHVLKRTIHVERAVAFGEIKATKTEATRSIDAAPGLVRMIREWIMREGIRGLLWPAADGDPIGEHDYRNWSRRVFGPAAIDAGFFRIVERRGKELRIPTITPYTLRHSFASLLIQEGRTAVEVSGQLGNKPTMTLDTYSHLFAEYRSGDRINAVDEIERAIAV